MSGPDPIEIGKALAAVGGGAYAIRGAARIGERVLGPTADVIGEALARYTEFRLRNVGRIVGHAESLLGERAEESGSVHPRVAAAVLEEGSWIDDEVMAEYFGGILASSRAEVGGDDRGAMWAALVARMSRFQIRAHYLVYGSIWSLMVDMLGVMEQILLLDSEEKVAQLTMCAPADLAIEVIQPPASARPASIVVHALTSLDREGLLSAPLGFQPEGHDDHSTLPDWFLDHGRGGMYASAAFPGLELFLWAHGVGTSPVQAFFDPSLPFTVDIPGLQEVAISPGAADPVPSEPE